MKFWGYQSSHSPLVQRACQEEDSVCAYMTEKEKEKDRENTKQRFKTLKRWSFPLLWILPIKIQ